MKKWVRSVVLSLIISGVLTGASASFAEQKEVSIPKGTASPGCELENRCYIPYTIDVKVSDSVIWKNNDVAAHTVTSGSAKNGPDGKFDSGLLSPDGEFSHDFTKPGTFPYYCMVHPWMEGIIISSLDVAPKKDQYQLKEGQISSDGKTHVTLQTNKPKAGQTQIIELRFTDEKGNLLAHMNYDILVTQNEQKVAIFNNLHTDDGTDEVTIKAGTDHPMDISISLRGIYLETEKTMPVTETIEFVKVPEFGILSVIILAIAMVSILVIGPRMRLAIKPSFVN